VKGREAHLRLILTVATHEAIPTYPCFYMAQCLIKHWDSFSVKDREITDKNPCIRR
jgi:hypothetical protein